MRNLNRNEIAVWLVLYRDVRSGIASTSQADMARRAEVSDRTVRRAVRRLQECGEQDWALRASAWISGPTVLKSMSRGTSVWLFLHPDTDPEDEDSLVGFGSLGETTWQEAGGRIAYIPMLAVNSLHQGTGCGRKILASLISEARERHAVIGLQVHSDVADNNWPRWR